MPSAGKPRQILALLALRAGRVVPVPTLMEEVWGSNIPRSAATTLQTYILQLRRHIAAALPAGLPSTAAKQVLATQFGGYQLATPVDSDDLAAFRRGTAEGSAALEAGDADHAARVLRAALDLWRGPALVDVPTGRILETEILGMDETRLRATELRVEADLRLGRHAEILGELLMLAAQHPLHENLCGQLMIALHRSGHTWRALDAYQRLRSTLVDELGVDPSPRLRRVHRFVLGGAPEPGGVLTPSRG
ncbi:AfsR/SARP family transcriptional regulator [Streptomyces xiamenensis]